MSISNTVSKVEATQYPKLKSLNTTMRQRRPLITNSKNHHLLPKAKQLSVKSLTRAVKA